MNPSPKDKKRSMLEGSPGRALFFFALPMILGNLFQQFYNMVDSMIVGRFVGEEALAAVGASYALTNVFVMIAIGGGIGASVITSQYLGAGNYEKMKTSVSTALFTFLGMGVLLGIFGFAMNRQILIWLNTPENILAAAGTYLGIYFLGMPFLFMYNILSSMFNALGDSRTPLLLLIFSSILNVFLDLWFVLQFGLGVSGVAIATVIAQGMSAVISFALLLRRLMEFRTEGCVEKYDTVILGSMVKIAVPSILQQSIVSIGMLLVQSVVNGFGSSVLAGYAAGPRIESICIVPMISTGNAVSTFTAQNMGADKAERARRSLYYSLAITVGWGLCCALYSQFLPHTLVGIFTRDDAVLAAGCAYLQSYAFDCVFAAVHFCFSGYFCGDQKSMVSFIHNITAIVLVRIPGAWLASRLFPASLYPMGWAAPLGSLLSAVICVGFYLYYRKRGK